ncbi:UNKNOWN [Stylonychia lemnae]|uniref:Transmembrane protein n=1 Tax=Stylonychia lemnae TaxID=5949 RepID=A0A078B4S3_STYLE|nr:UNKNOWN [Stylonychia lemnae]|eukprot:CDW88523.1 UNKNOWN [Stylonychia lemnae]
MDDTVKTVTRQAFTISDALNKTGGFMSILFVITLTMIQYLQETIYFTSLVKSLFKYQLVKEKQIQPQFKGIISQIRKGRVIIDPTNSNHDNTKKKAISEQSLSEQSQQQFTNIYCSADYIYIFLVQAESQTRLFNCRFIEDLAEKISLQLQKTQLK